MAKELNKKLSIIVPCYKVEQYLPKCLDSLVSQTLDDIEIICINDGSPDRCINILNDYKTRYPNKIIVIDKGNEGVWRGRSDGIRIAKGEYIGFVDSDDYVEPTFAESLYKAAKDADADIAVCGFKRIDLETGKTLSREMCTTRTPFLMQKDPGRILELNGAPWNKVFRASILKEMHDLQSPPPIFDDLVFHLLAYLDMKGAVVFVNKSLVNYMIRSGSIITSIKGGQVDAVFSAFRHVKQLYIEDKASQELKLALDAAAFLHLGVSLIFRLSYDSGTNLRDAIAKHTRFLDKEFPTWRKSPYINFKYAVKNGSTFKKILIVQRIYKMHLMPAFLALYRFVTDRMHIEIKW